MHKHNCYYCCLSSYINYMYSLFIVVLTLASNRSAIIHCHRVNKLLIPYQNTNRSIDPWMHQTITDDKNAYRKVQRMLEYQTHLDSIVKYITEPLVDEELEAEIEGGHYSKHS